MTSEFIYIASFDPKLIKIGRSKHPKQRIRQLSRFPDMAPPQMKGWTGQIVKTFPFRYGLESKLHDLLSPHRVVGFREWFNDSSILMDFIASIVIDSIDLPELAQLNVEIDKNLHVALKKESDRLGTKFNRYIDTQLRNSMAASATVRKLGMPSAER